MQLLRLITLLVISFSQSSAFQKVITVAINKKQVSSPLGPQKVQAIDNLKTVYPLRGGSNLSAVGPSAPFVTFDGGPLNVSTGIFLIVNSIGFIISVVTGSNLHLDLLGTGAFTIAALPNLLKPTSLRVFLSSSAVAIWGTKLASFLFFRALKVKTDGRLEDTLSTTAGTASFWFISFLWGVLCSLPHTIGTTSSNTGSPISLAIGSVLYLLGLMTETKADYQKYIFKQTNPGNYCNYGLWSVSQHPNFFGNMLLWLGIYVMNFDSLIETAQEGDNILSTIWCTRRAWLALISPLFMWALFNGQASGSITNSVELANKKYGSDVGFKKYINEVPLIIPNLFQWLKQLFSS